MIEKLAGCWSTPELHPVGRAPRYRLGHRLRQTERTAREPRRVPRPGVGAPQCLSDRPADPIEGSLTARRAAASSRQWRRRCGRPRRRGGQASPKPAKPSPCADPATAASTRPGCNTRSPAPPSAAPASRPAHRQTTRQNLHLTVGSTPPHWMRSSGAESTDRGPLRAGPSGASNVTAPRRTPLPAQARNRWPGW